MLCPECKNEFKNFKQYILHLDLVHKITNYFICPIDGCNRTYDTKYSLKDHLTAYHKLFSCRKYNSDETDIPANVSVLPASKSQSTEYGSVLSGQDLKNTVSIAEFQSTITLHNLDDLLLQIRNELNSNVINIITDLYNTLNIPRAKVQKFIDILKSFLKTTMCPVKKLLEDMIANHVLDKNSSKPLFDVINMFENCLNPVDTEHKLVDVFTKCGKLVQPVGSKIGVSKVAQRIDSGVIMHLKDQNVYMIPLGRTLKLFLELPGVLNTILSYQQDLMRINDGTLRNVVNGTLWKILMDNNTNTSIPLFVYFDDFESGNPLGSHAGKHKIGAVYSSLATVPPQYASRLENVFLTFLFYTNQRTTFGNKKIFDPLLTELKSLETTGIDIYTDSKKRNIKFPLTVLCGDNLGLNSVLGYVESFSANVYCRICTMDKTECQTAVVENMEKLRSKEDYDLLLQNNIGVKENCVWNSLESYHVSENSSVDVMHDLCEGVHRYSMAAIVKSLIDKKYFTLEQLNSRIKYFTYSKSEHNHPPAVTKQHLSNGAIIFSATEMLCFVRNFRFIVGDIIDENDEVWNYYLILLEITGILTSQAFSPEHLEHLKEVIREHHETYKQVFETHLKPKHHFMLHYPGIIKKAGPPIFFSAFKFEAKHKDLKQVTRSITSRKNLCYSVALRCELKNCCRYIANEGIKDNIKFSKGNCRKTPNNVPDNFLSVSTYEINGFIYDTTSSILLYYCKEDNPVFLKIKNIFVNDEDFKKVLVSCNKLRICGYNAHFKSYHVEVSDEAKLVSFTDCSDELPMSVRSVAGKMYVSWPSLLN